MTLVRSGAVLLATVLLAGWACLLGCAGAPDPSVPHEPPAPHEASGAEIAAPHVGAPPAEPVQLCAGSSHTCALLRDGRVACRGDNLDYQSSDDRAATIARPRFARFPSAVEVACGGARHVCARATDRSTAGARACP